MLFIRWLTICSPSVVGDPNRWSILVFFIYRSRGPVIEAALSS